MDTKQRTLLKLCALEKLIKDWKAELSQQTAQTQSSPTFNSGVRSFDFKPTEQHMQQPALPPRRPPVVHDRKIQEASYPERARLRPEWAALYDSLLNLANSPHAAPFRFSVYEMYDPISLVGYDRVVKTPMDFSRVLNGILRGAYASVRDVFADVAMIWQNCEAFNGPRHPLVLEKIPECKRMLAYIEQPSTAMEHPTEEADIDKLRRDAYENIEKLIEADEDSHLELIQFMQREAPACVSVDENEEYVLDLESENVTAAQLQKVNAYVSSALSQ